MMPKKPCKHSGCPRLTNDDYCEEHKKLHNTDRLSANDRGYDSRWRKARLMLLKVHPLCVRCQKEGKLTKATIVDHIIPHRGNQ